MRHIELIRELRQELTKDWKDVEFDIDDDLFLEIAKMAHARDITFNDMVVIALTEVLESKRLEDEEILENSVLGRQILAVLGERLEQVSNDLSARIDSLEKSVSSLAMDKLVEETERLDLYDKP